MSRTTTLESQTYAYNYYRQDLLMHSVLDCLPRAVCRLPVVMVGRKVVDVRLVTAVMEAIKLAWTVARGIGAATIVWDNEELLIKYGVIHTLDDVPHYYMFGHQAEWSKNFGLPCINEEVLDRICTYRLILKYVQGRIKNSYNLMQTIAGELSQDMAQATREEIDRRFQESRILQAPEGSMLHGHSVALADTDKVMLPFKEAIAIEANLPPWLLFYDLGGSQYILEEKARYLQDSFEATVRPAIIGLFALQDMDVRVITPTYRDSLYESTVLNMQSDTKYKDSSTADSYNTIELSQKEFDRGEAAPTKNKGRKL